VSGAGGGASCGVSLVANDARLARTFLDGFAAFSGCPQDLPILDSGSTVDSRPLLVGGTLFCVVIPV
jgi:hypothetical protein